MTQSDSTESYQIVAVFVAFILACIFLLNNFSFYHDDAYITLRYVSNFMNGDGLVWNSGEYVQGYTNFLHLILISILGFLGSDLVMASRLIGGIAYFLLILTVIYFGRKFSLDYIHKTWHLSAILVIASTPIIVWSISGLETVLFTLLITFGVTTFLLSVNTPSSSIGFLMSGLALGLAFLTRPDGFVIIVLTIGFLLFRIFQDRILIKQLPVDKKLKYSSESRYLSDKSSSLSDSVIFIVATALVSIPYLCFQYAYYGDIVPNTFYAKAALPMQFKIQTGFSYFIDYLSTFPLILLSMLLIFPFVWRLLRNYSFVYLITLISGYTIFIVFMAGGDHMPACRLFVPLIPLMSITLSWMLLEALKSEVVNSRVMTLSVLILCSLQLFDPKLNPKVEDSASFFGSIVGKYISKSWPKGSLIALNTAGSTPYYAEDYRFIDMLGLNDAVIARRSITSLKTSMQRLPGHSKGDGGYVLSRSPDYIILGYADGSSSKQDPFLSDLEIKQDPRFRKNYELKKVFLDANGTLIDQPEKPFQFLSDSNYVQKERRAYFLFRYYEKI